MTKGKKSASRNKSIGTSTTKISFNLQQYDLAIWELTNNVANSFYMLQPFFAKFPFRSTEHSGPIRSVRGEAPLDQPMYRIRVEATMSLDVIRTCNVEEYAVFLAELADARLKELTPQFFEQLNRTMMAVGNSVDAGGQPFSYALYLQVLEQIELSFDEDGEPILPELHCGPEMAQKLKECLPTEDEQRELKELLQRKKQEHCAKQRTRRLF